MDLNLLVIIIFGVISCLLGLAQLIIAFQQHLWILETRQEMNHINCSISSLHLGQHFSVDNSLSGSLSSAALRRSSSYSDPPISPPEATSFITCQSEWPCLASF